MACEIGRVRDFIEVKGEFHHSDLTNLLAVIHQATEKAGFTELTLDFGGCTKAFSSEMVGLCAYVDLKRNEGFYIHLNLPNDVALRPLFQNANWAFLIDPRRYEPANNNIVNQHIPATQYKTADEQFTIVNRVVENILGAIPEMQRSDFQAFEWAINEITDNVLTHSKSKGGGFLGLHLNRKRKIAYYTVADAGIGIPVSMRSGDYPKLTDVEALDHAIREGVTRDKRVGQGNGLYGSFEISHQCKGTFRLRSGNAELFYSEMKGQLAITNQKVPYNGTLVIGEVDFSVPGLLAQALRLGKKNHEPAFDFIDSKYAAAAKEDGTLTFSLLKEAGSFGSRPAGTPVRNKLRMLSGIEDFKKIEIDLEGVPIMSSSFADEAFGKLFKEIGPMMFMQKISFINAMPTCRDLIDKAISQRMKVD